MALIVERTWKTLIDGQRITRQGWYLFGALPLFVRDLNARDPWY